MSAGRRVLLSLEENLRALYNRIGKPFPALYLVAAGGELFKAATALAGTVRLTKTRSALASGTALAKARELCSLGSSASPVSTETILGSCCIWRAAACSSSTLGLQQADECNKALSALLQSTEHNRMQLLLERQHQNNHKQHHQHHSVNDALHTFMLGRSAFALFKSEPSKEVWLNLLAALSHPEELPHEQPHVLLIARRASGPRMQPRWVASRVSIQHPVSGPFSSSYTGSRR